MVLLVRSLVVVGRCGAATISSKTKLPLRPDIFFFMQPRCRSYHSIISVLRCNCVALLLYYFYGINSAILLNDVVTSLSNCISEFASLHRDAS
jgi:hypothetical protein